MMEHIGPYDCQQTGITRDEGSKTIMTTKMDVGRPDWIARNGLSREEEILTHCARLDLSPARRKEVKELLAAGELKWDLLLNKAAWHRLICLLSYHLRTADLSVFVPQVVLQKLQSLNFVNLARNMLLQDGLSELLSAFNREGIPVIVLKGAALLGSVYQDISLRPMSDLDILVKLQHLHRAEAIALSQGYVHFWERSTRDDAKIIGRHLPNLMHIEKRIMLEIHHHIVDLKDPYHFDLSGFWARAWPIKMLGASALTLAPEDLLIHLGINFLLDRRYGSNAALGQLCDISEVILHYSELDWDLVEKVAEEHGIASGLHFVLYACEQLLHTRVPASILPRLRPPDFKPSLAHAFFLRRVLDTRSWLAHDLVAPQLTYSRRRVLWAIIKRFFSVPEEIPQKNGFRRNTLFFYFRRMKNILPKLGGVLLRPNELKQDLLLDRWLHDIYGSA